MDHGLHDLAPAISALWDSRAAWPARFDRFRREEKLAPVRIVVLDTAGRVLYREGKDDTPLDDLAGRGAARLTQAQVIALLAGKSHLQDDLLYVVAPVDRGGIPVGILLGYIRPYSAVRPKSQPSSLLLLMLIPGLATLVVSSLASFYLARGLRARATALTRAIGSMADGDYRSRLPVTDDDEIGRVAGAFNAMADRLAEARAREETLERLKQELITNVSHDLRGPLTSIRGYLEAIEDGLAGNPETVRRYIGTIRQKSGQLAGLIEDLFLYARLESGDLPLDRRRVELADWLRESLAKAEPDLALAGLELAAEIPETAGLVHLDAARMDQVVANLAQNAIRYAPRGSTLEVRLQVVDGRAVITFKNEGPALDPRDLPHIFERFYRGRDRAEGMGAGLGLAIAARLVKSHGGEITAENLEGKGVAFRIMLGIEPPEDTFISPRRKDRQGE